MTQALTAVGVPRNYHTQFVAMPGLLDVVFTIVDDSDSVVATGPCSELSSGVYVTAAKVTLDEPGGYSIKFESAGAGLWSDCSIRAVRKAGAG